MVLALGFRPYSPFMELGIRMEPPMSVPQPTSEPRNESRAPSPPVDPPGVKAGFRAFVVRPNNGLSVSHHCGMSAI